MKNKLLCERKYCKEKWIEILSGYSNYFGGKGWSIRLCANHAKDYKENQLSRNVETSTAVEGVKVKL